jgi:putative PIN family toxin of toxin-antitoxin system
VHAVLDVNVVVSGLLSRDGAPAAVLRALEDGEFDAVASPQLVTELTRTLAYPKLRRRISADDAAAILDWFAGTAVILADSDGPPPGSRRRCRRRLPHRACSDASCSARVRR